MPEIHDPFAVVLEWIKAISAAPVGGIAGWITHKWRSHTVEESLKVRLSKLEGWQDRYEKDKQESSELRKAQHIENRADIQLLRDEVQKAERRNKWEIREFTNQVKNQVDKQIGELAKDNREQFGELKKLLGFVEGRDNRENRQ